ncbi:MAG: hypothetical protein IT326_08715 [Anaerolineae bacterium]|nr:hypothetical protein [Anaerolineae bacterium]
MRRAVWSIGLTILLVTACSTPGPTGSMPSPPTVSTPLSSEASLSAAYQIDNPVARQAAVLRRTAAFLQSDTARRADDLTLSTLYTQAAFSSGRLALDSPVFIRRQGSLALIGLPDSMGIYLIDLDHADAPVLVSPWTAGITRLDVAWRVDALGIVYETAPLSGPSRTHFALMRFGETGWETAWLSDTAPDWWINTQGATLAVSEDLSRLVVTGPAPGTSALFDEATTGISRTLQITWERNGDRYRPVPLPESYRNRAEWLRATAQPSPYATLVEFLERLVTGDTEGAAQVATNPDAVSNALAFGLNYAGRRYIVTRITGGEIEFRDTRGAFIVTFQAGTPGAGPAWLIDTIRPLGAPAIP